MSSSTIIERAILSLFDIFGDDRGCWVTHYDGTFANHKEDVNRITRTFLHFNLTRELKSNRNEVFGLRCLLVNVFFKTCTANLELMPVVP
ncbi:MAG: hypothetical protein JO327_06930 [Nitrososphaeraceae archaeon]|nr:hypothetical protein [Nitrososphaeraceae archaeon]